MSKPEIVWYDVNGNGTIYHVTHLELSFQIHRRSGREGWFATCALLDLYGVELGVDGEFVDAAYDAVRSFANYAQEQAVKYRRLYDLTMEIAEGTK